MPFDIKRRDDEWYTSDFFGRNSFELKLTHQGRSRISQSGQNTVPIESEDRKFGRLAIEEARKSISESDGRPHPKVGAVVVKDGKALITAHRGESPASHAEYIALEKKLPDEAVAGATVYTTLEPCTTRNHPKIPCAERLIERRVARVVIGMLDPDDRITGKGLRRLRKAGIVTDLFPSDLMTEVEEINREFTRFCEQKDQTQEPLHSNKNQINGEVLQTYMSDDSKHDACLVILLRIVSELSTSLSIVDFRLTVVTEDGDTLEGKLDPGDLASWVLLTDYKEPARYRPVTSIVRTVESRPDPPLLHALGGEPLEYGIHKEGWLAFSFPSDKSPWETTEKIEKAKSITVDIVDALKRTHKVSIAKPWNQPSRIIHRSWFP